MSPTLPERSLGTQGFKGSAMGYGCMSLTGFVTPDVAEGAETTLRHVLEAGVTVINTASFYGAGENHKVIGRAMKELSTEKVKIAAKWGPFVKPDGSGLGQDYSRAACRAQCEQSLKSLGVEHLDLYIARGPCNARGVLEEAITAMKEFVEEGKVKYIGLSEFAPADVRRAHAIHPITALEMEWSLFTRDAEEELVPTARELGIGFLAYSPLGRGMLTGQLKELKNVPDTDWRKAHNPRFQGDNFTKNLQLAENVESLAAKKGCTPGQLALAWVLARGPDVIPIPGTKRASAADENIAALHVQLSQAELKELEDAVPHHQVAGDRYPSKHMTFKHGDS